MLLANVERKQAKSVTKTGRGLFPEFGMRPPGEAATALLNRSESRLRAADRVNAELRTKATTPSRVSRLAGTRQKRMPRLLAAFPVTVQSFLAYDL